MRYVGVGREHRLTPAACVRQGFRPCGRHGRDETVEEVARIMRTGRRFRVILYTEDRKLTMGQPFDRPVVEVDVGHAKRRRASHLVAGPAPDREAVVLRSDLDDAILEPAHRVVPPRCP